MEARDWHYWPLTLSRKPTVNPQHANALNNQHAKKKLKTKDQLARIAFSFYPDPKREPKSMEARDWHY
jgi:hypothetical protein